MYSVVPFLFSSLITQSTSLPLAKRAFSNGPVITADFPDPSLLQINGTYYSFATQSGGKHIQSASSPDFGSWTVSSEDALPDLPSWSNGQTWAPDVIQLGNGTFLMYFSALYTDSNNMHCIGTAISDTIFGPYTPSEMPLICPLAEGGAIDSSSFTDTDGTLYLTYKVDANSLGGGGACGNEDEANDTPIMLQVVGPDGITKIGDPVQILSRDADDGPLVEAPYLVLYKGIYFLFYSSHCFNSPDYNTKYATAPSITGPYTKAASPLLVSGGDDGALNSPGGASVSRDGTQMVFHADSEPDDSRIRQMWTAGISIEGTVMSIS